DAPPIPSGLDEVNRQGIAKGPRHPRELCQTERRTFRGAVRYLRQSGDAPAHRKEGRHRLSFEGWLGAPPGGSTSSEVRREGPAVHDREERRALALPMLTG